MEAKSRRDLSCQSVSVFGDCRASYTVPGCVPAAARAQEPCLQGHRERVAAQRRPGSLWDGWGARVEELGDSYRIALELGCSQDSLQLGKT